MTWEQTHGMQLLHNQSQWSSLESMAGLIEEWILCLMDVLCFDQQVLQLRGLVKNRFSDLTKEELSQE